MNKIKLSIILCGLTLLFMACSKSSDSSDNSQESKSIDDIIPPTLLTNLKNRMNIYEGDTPPSIDGCYLISPAILVSSTLSKDKIGDEFADDYIKFTNQNSNNSITYNSIQEGGDTSSSNSVSIRGTGNYFTAYFTAYNNSHNDSDNATATSTTATVISGEKTSSGIKNIKYAFLMISKDDPDSILVPINTIRVFTDGDSLAENTTWPTEEASRSANYTCKNKIKYLKSATSISK